MDVSTQESVLQGNFMDFLVVSCSVRRDLFCDYLRPQLMFLGSLISAGFLCFMPPLLKGVLAGCQGEFSECIDGSDRRIFKNIFLSTILSSRLLLHKDTNLLPSAQTMNLLSLIEDTNF